MQGPSIADRVGQAHLFHHNGEGHRLEVDQVQSRSGMIKALRFQGNLRQVRAVARNGLQIIQDRKGLIHRRDAFGPKVIQKGFVEGVVLDRHIAAVVFADVLGPAQIAINIVPQVRHLPGLVEGPDERKGLGGRQTRRQHSHPRHSFE